MERELLRLALVNHAIAYGIGYDIAWPLVDEVMAREDDAEVRELADAVRLAVTDRLYGALL